MLESTNNYTFLARIATNTQTIPISRQFTSVGVYFEDWVRYSKQKRIEANIDPGRFSVLAKTTFPSVDP
jgi:hypothetical protein